MALAPTSAEGFGRGIGRMACSWTVLRCVRRRALMMLSLIIAGAAMAKFLVNRALRVTAFVAVLGCATSASATVVSDWNTSALAEVRLSRSLRNGPPIVARALAIAHTCMHDASAAFDDIAVGT